MVLATHHEIWPALRRIGETRGRIAALDYFRRRHIELGVGAPAPATASQIERLKKGLDYHQHVLVAVRARLARSHAQPEGLNALETSHGPTYPTTPLRRSVPRRSVEVARQAEDAA
jgi:hypothetical protein